MSGPVYVRRQFFYNYPYSTHHFYETTLPSLKRSLSLTLQHFFPLAGNLLCPPKPHKPFISCSADDSVTFTIIESAADFNHLSANHPKSLKEYNHLVAKLTYTMVDDDIEVNLEGQTHWSSQTSERVNGDEDYVKATIVFSRDDIEKLKRQALNEWKKNDEFINAPQYLSKFVVTCAFVWACLVKTRCRNGDDHQEESDHVKEEYFRFAADCRDRLEYPIPATYFGNCLTRCHAMLKRKDIKGEGGFLNAVRAIERAITDMKVEPFEGAENWKASFKKMFVLGSTVLVTGSPKFTVYETDFGFGRPLKVEMAHSFKCMSLAESGDMEGGLEFGLIFRSREFEYFISVIEQGLQAAKS
ncbi:Transferase [Sesbania bispinosa]|nr:Transferase [Sesbania bispinosa]